VYKLLWDSLARHIFHTSIKGDRKSAPPMDVALPRSEARRRKLALVSRFVHRARTILEEQE
jgi:hypothetical protein